MKKILLLVFLIPLLSISQFKVPERFIGTCVHDYDNVLTVPEKADLDRKIQLLRDSTTVEVAIVVLSDLQGFQIDQVSLKIGREWGVGKKETNNGIVYLLSPKNRKARFEVGSGLEGDLSDLGTSRMQDKVKLFYKKGEYYNGINSIVDDIINTIGLIGPEQRKIIKAKKEIDNRNIKENVNKILLWLFLLSVVGFIIYLLVKNAQRIRLQEEAEVEEKRQKSLYISKLKDLYLGKNIFIRNVEKKYLENYNKLTKYEEDKSLESIFIKSIKFYEDKKEPSTLDSFSLEELKDLYSSQISDRNKITSFVESIYSRYKTFNDKENFVASFINEIDTKRNKAKEELKNTPFLDVRDDLYHDILKNKSGNLIFLYLACVQLSTHYNNIISYRDNQLKEKKRLEQKKKDDEEYEERRRRQSSSVSSYESSYRGGSSSSANSYSGGSFSGGGSSSDW